MSIIAENLQRIKDLAVQSANGVYATSERESIDQEVQLRLQEIDRIATSSSFSELKLLDGSLSGTGKCTLQIGAGSDVDENTIDISDAFGQADCASLGLDGQNVTTEDAATAMIEAIDAAVTVVTT